MQSTPFRDGAVTILTMPNQIGSKPSDFTSGSTTGAVNTRMAIWSMKEDGVSGEDARHDHICEVLRPPTQATISCITWVRVKNVPKMRHL